ncbi:hypothetical protein N7504_003264 [Penicillium tannophilum]|nr:hypothetical protein N7504_003264 [Penicillium tannophilum]
MASFAENGRSGNHFFCPSCGTGIMAKNHMIQEGESNIAVNVGGAFLSLPSLRLESPYDSESVSAPFHGKLPKASGDSLKLYTGGCYCGAVTIAVELNHLSEVEIKENNCSICQRRKFNGHCFCRVCGVHVYMKLHGPPKTIVDNLPAEKQKMVQEKLAIVPVRLSVLDGVEWSDCSIKRSDEGTAGYAI